MREAVRARLHLEDRPPAGAGWEIVINPRVRAMTAPFPQLEREVDRLLERCAN
jgi:RNase P protein component